MMFLPDGEPDPEEPDNFLWDGDRLDDRNLIQVRYDKFIKK